MQHEVTQVEDQPMTGDEEIIEAKPSTNSGQNNKLYTAEGILDPRVRKAEKKRRKTHKASMMDADYDFKVDYVGKEVTAGGNEGKDDDDDDEIDSHIGAEAPMSGIELGA